MSTKGKAVSWHDVKESAKLASVVGSAAMASDPTNESPFGTLTPFGSSVTAHGTVVRSDVGNYTCTVSISGRLAICNILVPIASNTFGYSFGALPVEGTKVVVLLPWPMAPKGWILGVDPAAEYAISNKPTVGAGKNIFTGAYKPYDENPVYKVPLSGKMNALRLRATSYRPMEQVPNEVSITNEWDCGFYLGAMSASLLGGFASVKATPIDDTVRIVCKTFQDFNAHDIHETYNNLGFLSGEHEWAVFQGERLGDVDSLTAKKDDKSDKPKVVRSRLKLFTGFIGNLLNFFVQRPKDRDVKKGGDEGVFHANVDGSGRLSVRSAGGIALERYDRIPVPRRIGKLFDPENSTGYTPQAIKPFKLDNPYYAPLALSDRMAYEAAAAYKRFDEEEKLYETPQEKDMKCPGDDVDSITKSKSNLSQYDKRRAGVYVQDDGSLVFRDGWGSEMVFIGGNIYISAAANVFLMPGRSTIVMSGKDTVLKAKGCVDVTATDNDVTIKAERSMKLVAGSDDGKGGGIMLESLSESNGSMSKKDSGMNASINGIILKAAKSSVVVSGESSLLHAKKNLSVVTGEEDEKRDGQINIAGGQVLLSGQDGIRGYCDESYFSLSKTQFIGFGGSSATLMAQSGVSLIKGKQAGVPIWTDLKEDPTTEQAKQAKDAFETLQGVNSFGAYPPDKLEELVTSLRSSDQCGTMTGTEIQPAPQFTFYEPYWYALKQSGNPILENVKTDTWEEHPVHGQMPWPGKDAYKSGKYAELSKPVNLKDGVSVDRSEVKDSVDVELKSLKDYPVLK